MIDPRKVDAAYRTRAPTTRDNIFLWEYTLRMLYYVLQMTIIGYQMLIYRGRFETRNSMEFSLNSNTTQAISKCQCRCWQINFSKELFVMSFLLSFRGKDAFFSHKIYWALVCDTIIIAHFKVNNESLNTASLSLCLVKRKQQDRGRRISRLFMTAAVLESLTRSLSGKASRRRHCNDPSLPECHRLLYIWHHIPTCIVTQESDFNKYSNYFEFK